MTITLLSILLGALTALIAAFVFGLFARYLAGRARIVAIAVLLGWLLYAGVLGYTGVLASSSPPGPPLVLLPVVIFLLVFLVRHPGVREFGAKMPTALLIGVQVFRLFVELILHGLYGLHQIPRLLTFEGANFDILIALTAPVIAGLYATHQINATVVRVWSFIGIAMLANVVVRAVLSTPGPLHLLQTDPPNTGMWHFPFTYIPGFLAPLALYLHVLVLRSLPNVSVAPAGNIGHAPVVR